MDPNVTPKSDEWVEDRYVYYSTVPSLQEITSFRIAQQIWSSYVSRSKNRNDSSKESMLILVYAFNLPETYEKDIHEAVDLLKLPRIFETMLRHALTTVIRELRMWIRHLGRCTISFNIEQYAIEDFDPDWCVWSSTGRIDYKQTAIKLLSTVDLSNEQRFAILSEFCMEKEISQMQLRSLSKTFRKSVNIEDNPLAYYWICYLRRDGCSIPYNSYRSVYAAVAAKCGRFSWTAFEYFWGRCDVADRISVARYLLDDHRDGYRYQEKLLSMMSWFQQRRVLTLIPEQIISNFCFHLDSSEATFWAWKHSKLNPTSFAKIVRNSFLFVTNEEKMSRFIEIWDAASPIHKGFTVYYLQDEIFRAFNSGSRPSQSAFKFLIKFLSHHDAIFREREVLSNAVLFGKCIDDLNLVNELLELSFPSFDDQAQFKRRVGQSPDLLNSCVHLMTRANLADLNAKLQFYLPDSDAILKYKHQLITSELMNIELFLYYTNKWNAFSTIVDETFPDDASAALRMKKKYILLHARCFPHSIADRAYDVNPMIQIVESVFDTKNKNENIKDVFFDNFVAMLKKKDYRWCKKFFNEMYFRRFVRWCLGEEDGAVLRYNRGAFMHAVVTGVLGAMHNHYVARGEFNETLLHDLNRCLIWYLTHEERVKEYKLEWVKVIHHLDIVQSAAQRNDTVSLEALWNWFFDEDQDAIQQFKSKRVKIQ